MSSLPSQRSQNVTLEENENFAKFFEHWLAEQDRLLHLLLAVASNNDDSTSNNNEEGHPGEEHLRALVDRVLGHYEHYYRAKAASARHDAVPMFDPQWRSSSEKMFMWVGGWRPSVAVQLLYSKSGIQLEEGLESVLRGVQAGDLAGLSPDQIARVDELHRRTVGREREITEAAAEVQETVVGADVVGLSHALTEMKNQQPEGEEREEAVEVEVGQRMETLMRRRKEGMAGILARADDLRLETLKAVAAILNPEQAVHFLIAAAEVHLRVHEWGKTAEDAGSDRE